MQTTLGMLEPDEEGSNGESRRFLSASEVASRLDVTPQTVYRWAKVGILPARRLGPRTLRFEEQDLDALMVPPMEAASEPTPEPLREVVSQNQQGDLLDALADRIIAKLKHQG